MIERSLLADAVETFFGERCTPDTVARIEAGGDGGTLWHETEELGLTLASVPEAAGGQGGSLIDALTILRAAGRHAVPLPLAETGVLAGWILASAGLVVGPGALTIAPVNRAETIKIERVGDGAVITGRAARVPWAQSATRIVVLAYDDAGRPFAGWVRPSAAEIRSGKNLAGEPRDSVEFTRARLQRGTFGEMPNDVEVLYLRGALTRAVLMLGALEQARDLAVAYSKGRVQFGRPIAHFQAVQHLVAQIARDVAVTRAAVELAVSAAADDVPGAWLEIASAKVAAGLAAGSVSARAHQVHGAIGTTREYPLTALTRRLWSWRDEFGTEAEWSRRIGEQAWRAKGGVWGLASSARLF
jgi:acyl-CoA dehydrogenase